MKKYHIIIFGCQMNYADAERVSAVLSRAGFIETKKEKNARIIVVIMCSIRQSAVDRIHWLAEKFCKLKTKNRKLTTILTGCILEKDKKVFINGFDYVIDIKNISQLPKIIKKNKKTLSHSREDKNAINNKEKYLKYLNIEPKHNSSFSANVPIMTGCNNFCAYCVVPYTRDREISRPAKNIITEVKKLIKNGYKEIWLLGQNVNSYKDKNNKSINGLVLTNNPIIGFAELLQEINKIKGEFWIRFTSSHPKDFKENVINAMAKGNHITPYLNLPVQSGDDNVLRSMNRHYTIKQYKKIISNLRKKVPNIAISTDIIVGFPGETKKQFNNTVKLFSEIKYDMAYINKYSPRLGTASYKMKDSVSWQEKKHREKMLTDTLRKTASKNNKNLIGKTIKVLIDSQKNKIFYGKSDTYKSVRITPITNISYSRELKIGQFVKIKITKANNWNLEGKLYEIKK